MKIEVKTHASGLREIRAVDELGTVAMAIEHNDPERWMERGTYWHLTAVYVPPGAVDPGGPYPRLDTADAARGWVTFLGAVLGMAREAWKRTFDDAAVSQ